MMNSLVINAGLTQLYIFLLQVVVNDGVEVAVEDVAEEAAENAAEENLELAAAEAQTGTWTQMFWDKIFPGKKKK